LLVHEHWQETTMKQKTRRALLALAATACLAAPLGALAQTASTGAGPAWPAKQPIKLIAVFPPGGSVDQVARLLAQPLSLQLGQSVVVEKQGRGVWFDWRCGCGRCARRWLHLCRGV
jgi:hypothetical protein